MKNSPAQRRYNRRVVILALLYAGLLLPASYLLSRQLVTGPAAVLLAILPSLPVVGFFATAGLYLIEEQDEYLRMLFARQSLVATGVAMTVATIWGFLEAFDLAAHAPAYIWAAMWFIGLGLGAIVNRKVEGHAA